VARNAGYYRAPRDVDEVIALVQLQDQRRTKVKDLSGGQKRRLDLALGVIGDPRLLFLDEPTTGFDPSARQGAWQVVRDLRAGGTTVVLTTHYMEEAQELADRVAVIAGGQIVAEGDPDTIGGRDTDRARIRFTLPTGAEHADVPVPPTMCEGRSVIVEVDDPTEVLHRPTGWALERGTTLPDLAVQRPTLEDRLSSAHRRRRCGHPDASGRCGQLRRRGNFRWEPRHR
jgi:ABC-2 type transport system ATP-binding protein